MVVEGFYDKAQLKERRVLSFNYKKHETFLSTYFEIMESTSTGFPTTRHG